MGKKSTKRTLDASHTKETKRQSLSQSKTSTEDDSSNSDSSDYSEEFEVEAIVGIRDIKPGESPQFFVKWVGYSDEHNTWEPMENLENCKEILKSYLISLYKRNKSILAAVNADSHTITDLDSTISSCPAASLSEPSQHVVPLSQYTFINQSKNPSAKAEQEQIKLPIPSLLPPLPPLPPPEEPLSVRLKAFQDIFKNSIGPRITIENTVDDAACPPGFKYINECIYGKGVTKPDPQFASRCECENGECTIENGCPCMQEAQELNDFECIPFENDGRVSEKAGKLLWECNINCSCGPSCISRISQQGRRFAMKIKRYPDKGWGVILDQDQPIPPRTFVARYIGEIILNQEADIRGREYDEKGATWLFDLDYNTELEAKYSIDAYKQGNESHFFNHSCDPNLSVYILVGGDTGGDVEMMTLSFWSNRTIQRGEELTFDYNGNYLQPWLEDSEKNKNQKQIMKYNQGMTPCLCGSANCRRYVYI
ncbi:Eukaryotic translation initiation factor 2 subunit 3 [Entomortierella beljakovae]|nr:Eukaryotic translation initiation factor 2 subunit 3 [Entomortierella beljakovae]